MDVSKKWLVDASERVGMACVYAIVSEGIVLLAGIDQAWAVALTAGLNLVKVVVARKVGEPDSASLVPTVGESTNANTVS